MKKSLKIIISTILILLFLQQCTDINLIPAFVENKDDYKSMYFGVESDTFKVAKITDKTVSFITYDTINNYFIVDTGYEKMKIDANGDVIIKFPEPSGELPYKTHFLFTDSTVFDLSKIDLKIEPYHKIINPKEVALEQKWISLFEEYYNKAAIVIYGDEDLVYMMINENWLLLYLDENYYVARDNIGENTFEDYPAKHDKLIFLRDTEANIYSDWSSRSDRPDQDYYPENELKYSIEPIEKIGFKKEKHSEKYAYTPILARFNGIGYYKLKKGEDYIYFKENATKDPFAFFKTESSLNHFTIPEKFKSKTEISFINNNPSNDQNGINGEGIYIVKRKRSN